MAGGKMATETTVLAIEHIVKTPGVCGGRPRVAGRRITVDFIVNGVERLGASIDEMVEAYDLSPAQVHAALAYYYDNRGEINSYIAEAERLSADATTGWRDEAIARARARHGTEPELYMTIAEVASDFDLNPSTIRRAIYAGQITARKAGGVWLVSRKDAEARWGSK
jgi:uncharacterized protein (DUF433 family)